MLYPLSSWGLQASSRRKVLKLCLAVLPRRQEKGWEGSTLSLPGARRPPPGKTAGHIPGRNEKSWTGFNVAVPRDP